MKKKKIWKRELARDFLSLGSWVFYLLVLARAAIELYRPFVDQIIIGGIFLLILQIAWRQMDGYTARGIVLIYFTSEFYQSYLFTIFAIIIGVGLIISSYLTREEWRSIAIGIATGAVATLLSSSLSDLTIRFFS